MRDAIAFPLLGFAESAVRCYFMKNKNIAGVALLSNLSDKEAVEKSLGLFLKTPAHRYDGFEIWDLPRFVMRHEGRNPPPFAADVS